MSTTESISSAMRYFESVYDRYISKVPPAPTTVRDSGVNEVDQTFFAPGYVAPRITKPGVKIILTREQEEQLIQLRAEGVSWDAIEAEMRIGRTCLNKKYRKLVADGRTATK